MSLSLLFPEFMDLKKPCLTCRYYCKSHSVRWTDGQVAKKRARGEQVDYEYRQKYCTYQKSYVWFNWNCPTHDNWGRNLRKRKP